MTEAEWNSCDNPTPMMRWLQRTHKLSDRKVRLLAVACCLRIWPQLQDERSRAAVEVAQRYSDGQASRDELRSARSSALAARTLARQTAKATGFYTAIDAAADAAYAVTAEAILDTPMPSDSVIGAVGHAANAIAAHAVALAVAASHATVSPDAAAFAEPDGPEKAWDKGRHAEWTMQAALLRELFGPLPFRSVTINPLLLNDEVVKLAQDAYENRLPDGTLDPARLGTLADALELAGCDYADMVLHLHKQGQVHYRGCFVLDLLRQET